MLEILKQVGKKVVTILNVFGKQQSHCVGCRAKGLPFSSFWIFKIGDLHSHRALKPYQVILPLELSSSFLE